MFKTSSILVVAFGFVSFTIASCGPVNGPVDASDVAFGGKPTTTKVGKGGGKKNDTTTPTVSGTGVAHFMTDEFGNAFYGIETADGTRYEVLNFPSGAFADGQTVNFTGYLVSGYTMTNDYGQALLLSAITAA
jgi:hypothetical protein